MAAGDDLFVTADVTIPAWELSEAFVRASGPGGQNVNKVSSAVQLRWTVDASSIPAEVKARFKRLYRARITTDGEIIIEAKEHRRQSLNREAARDRLKEMVLKATEVPKRRVRTKPTYGSVKRRIKAKKIRGDIKNLRGKIDPDD